MSTVSHEDAIEVLNRVHAADPSVLPSLINFRVPCNDLLAEDPTVQVGRSRRPGGDATWEVGLLGILNGIFGTQGDRSVGFIAAYFDDEGNLQRFEVNDGV